METPPALPEAFCTIALGRVSGHVTILAHSLLFLALVYVPCIETLRVIPPFLAAYFLALFIFGTFNALVE
jgi:hypothetical protein